MSNKYDSYKDSGIEWIGEIPLGWELMTVRRITQDHKQGYYSPEGYKEDGHKLVRITDLDANGNIDTSTSPFVSPTEKELEVFEIKKGDILFPRTGSVGLVGVAKNDMKAVFASYLIRFRFSDKTENSFMRYYFISEAFLNGLFSDLHGGVNQNIHAENIKDQWISLPSLLEQTTIATYLDQKTTQIDDLIAKKERLIQLLEEESTAIINQAVTKGLPAEERLKVGLDPTVPMKESGIEWLGEIPAHWEVTSLKRLIEVKDGTHDTPNYVEEGIPFITTKDIIKKEISFSQCKFITYEDYEKINKRSDVCIGDIIMPMIGSIGSPIIVNTDTPFSIKNLALIKNNSNCDIRFIRYYLDSELTMFQFELNASGGVQNFVSLGSLRNLKIPKLTKEEQIKIADFLDFKENQFEECINKINNEIKLLKEYKTALISEVVTGKVDVRNEIINQQVAI